MRRLIATWQGLHDDCSPSLAPAERWNSVAGFSSPQVRHRFRVIVKRAYEARRETSGSRGGLWKTNRMLTVLLRLSYLTKLIILNMGRYSAMTMTPTVPPMTTINRGSIRLVIDSTAASTSWS